MAGSRTPQSARKALRIPSDEWRVVDAARALDGEEFSAFCRRALLAEARRRLAREAGMDRQTALAGA